MPKKLSEYERLREENIARNRQLLAELNLDDGGSAGLGAPAIKGSAKPVQPRDRKRKAEDDAPVPRRQSTRLRRTAATENETAEERKQRETEDEERRRQLEEERIIANEKALLAKRPRHEQLDLSLLAKDASDEEHLSLRTALTAICREAQSRRIGDDEQTWEDDQREDRDVAALKAAVSSMKIVSRAKVTQDRVYSMVYHPDKAKSLIFVGDKHGQLGIWDAQAPCDEFVDADGNLVPNQEGGHYWQLQTHWPATSRASISSIKLDPIEASSIFTSSYDCSIRQFSLAAGVSREILSLEDALITCLDLPTTGHEIWASDALGGVTHLDLREHRSQARRYGLSDNKIGSVSLNPVHSFALATASNNQFLRLWDVRNMNCIPLTETGPMTPPPTSPPRKRGVMPMNEPTEIKAERIQTWMKSKQGAGLMKGEWQHRASATSGYWDPAGRRILSTSYDNNVRVWDIWPSQLARENHPLESFRPLTRASHNCQTGRWLTVFKAQWSPNPDAYPHFTIGNMNHSLDIITYKGEVVRQLSDSTRISAVQAVTASHPSILTRAVSGNASGRCVLWADDIPNL